ncbi:methylenetetrahydrofolate reductase [Halalkalibacter nanhaiisediminis]|uniref:Methylenetetrahydrofolate reductase n=1 Tax=Halalkalibacter nanhaiisediminis TaxID=688079 RepID=A0A562QQR8_9BACI|nr:methylenetetrahydrofolate reductase [Halalkalibacter nanhaiisediminis]TWI59101.1 methylenetetrahydrofolate reductase (NADPH) [Halalkalibacter nanhaiisediminis]
MSIYLGNEVDPTNHFTVTAELVPPRDWNPYPIIEQAASYRGLVDAVDISDNLLAVARMSPTVCAFFIRQIGVNPIVQINLRDRNRMGIQSDLLGLAALGIKNITILGGYPAKVGTEPEAKEVYDLRTMELVRYVKTFIEEGKLFDGTLMEEPPQMTIGTVENIAGKPIPELIDSLESKVEAGANFVRTQLVFDIDLIEEWMEEARRRGLHERVTIMASILPLRDAAHVDKAIQIPGIVVPEWVKKRLAMNDSEEEGLQIATDIINKLKKIEGMKGVHIRPIGGNEDSVRKILTKAGLSPFKKNLAVV